MKNVFGRTGNLLRVNLSSRKTFVEPSGPYLRQFLGGRGMGRWILFKELDPSIGPLDAENKLVLSAGPLVGTMAPMSCRLSVETKNVQAGGVCSSNVGGYIAPELKYAGFDAVIIEGKCQRPSWFLITDVMGDGHENMKFFSPFTGVFRSCQAGCCPPRNSRDTAPRSSALPLQRCNAFSGSCGAGRASSVTRGRR